MRTRKPRLSDNTLWLVILICGTLGLLGAGFALGLMTAQHFFSCH